MDIGSSYGFSGYGNGVCMIARCPRCLGTSLSFNVRREMGLLLSKGFSCEMTCLGCGTMIFGEKLWKTPNEAIADVNRQRISESLRVNGLINYDRFGNIVEDDAHAGRSSGLESTCNGCMHRGKGVDAECFGCSRLWREDLYEEDGE